MAQSSDVDIVLFQLPNKTIEIPPLGTAILKGALTRRGHACRQIDLNVALKDELITVANLSCLGKEVLPWLWENNIGNVAVERHLEVLARCIDAVEKEFSLEELVRVKELTQRRAYESVFCDRHRAALFTKMLTLLSLSSRFFELVVSNSDIEAVFPELFVFRRVDQQLGASMLRRTPVVGFSVVEMQRQMTIWAIERLRSKFGYDGLVVVGGSDVTYFTTAYLKHFASIDFAVYKEGEIALVELLDRLKSGEKTYEHVPNLVFRKNDSIVVTEASCPTHFTEIVPDFDGLPMDKYLTNGLPVQASRGCSWAHCTYCKHFRTYGKDYYEGDPREVVGHIAHLKQKHGTSLFHFVDDDMPYKLKNSIADILLERNLDIEWLAYSRFDRNISREMLTRWHNAGLRVIEWGVESASSSVLTSVKKGTTVPTIQSLLLESHSVGMLNKVFMFHNLPSESFDDLWESISFLSAFIAAGVVRPFWEILTPLELLIDTPLYRQSMAAPTAGEAPFRRVFGPRGDLIAQGGYVPRYNYEIKKSLLTAALMELKHLCNRESVIDANDEAILFDVVLERLRLQGSRLAVRVRLAS